MEVVAGVDLGGTAVNYTLIDSNENFLIQGLCEYPALAKQGPEVCLKQITDGLSIAVAQVGLTLDDVVAIGLDTPGPASSTGKFSLEGPTNFLNKAWSLFDIRGELAHALGKPVSYLNDANAAAIWGHYSIFGANSKETSISSIVGTGNGGGVIVEGSVVKGKNGFGGELGHVMIQYQTIEDTEGITARCNCGRTGDLESLCSLTGIANNILPYYLARNPDHVLATVDILDAAKRVRGLAERGDELARSVFKVQAHALGLFFDEMINTFDPDALIVGGGALETGKEFQDWFISEIRRGMPRQRAEQLSLPIHVMPNGDTAGSRGAAIEALKMAREGGLAS